MRSITWAAALLLACDGAPAVDRSVVVPVASPSDAAAPVVVVRAAAPRGTAREECPSSDVGDALAALVLPRGAAGYCVDGGSTKTYGDDAKFSLADSCATLLDGECEVYVKHGARRIVSTRYFSTANSAHAVYVVLTRFGDARGAADMLALRAERGVGDEVAYIARGPYFAELAFSTDDPLTLAEMRRFGKEVNRPLARLIDERASGLSDAR